MAGGPDHNFLRLMIRDRLAKGTLFPAPERVWAKHGTGRICSACGTAISPQDAESEMIVGLVTVWAHLTCHMIWQEESGGDRVERTGLRRKSASGTGAHGQPVSTDRLRSPLTRLPCRLEQLHGAG
jgi:hypothetical protein